MIINHILKDLMNLIKHIKERRAIKSKNDTTLSLYTEKCVYTLKIQKGQ